MAALRKVLGAFTVGTAVLVAGCGANGNAGSVAPVEHGKGGGSASCDPSQYPCGPFGYQKGSAIENLQLVGRKDANKDGKVDTSDPVTTIQLSDYFQDKNIEALVISATAEWCGPCNEEQPSVEDMYQRYQQAGGHVAIMEASIQANDGSPADMSVADRWRAKYGITFDMVVDPSEVLSPYYNINAFPMNMVVRTRDMTIVYSENGLDPQGLKAAIDSVLANP